MRMFSFCCRARLRRLTALSMSLIKNGSCSSNNAGRKKAFASSKVLMPLLTNSLAREGEIPNSSANFFWLHSSSGVKV